MGTLRSIIGSLLLFLVLSVSAFGQNLPTIAYPLTVTSQTADQYINVKSQGIQYWQLAWQVGTTTPSTCNIQLDYSVTGSGAAIGQIITATGCTSTTSTAVTNAIGGNYVRINPSTFTGAGASLNVILLGWVTNPQSSGGVTSGVNLQQVSGVAITLGQKAMASSLPVVIASDQSGISINATQTGTWTVQPGNTPNTTAWLVRPNDGTNSIAAAISAWGVAPTGTEVEGINSNLFINGVLAAAAASGIQRVGITGGAGGASIDSTIAPGAAAANGINTLAQYRASSPAPTANQATGLQMTSNTELLVKPYRRSGVVCQPTTITSSASATTIVTAGAANVFNDLTNLIITVTPAATTDLAFTATLSDGTNSFIYDMDTGALATATADPTIINANFNPPMTATSSATAWTLQLSSASVTVHVTACYNKTLVN